MTALSDIINSKQAELTPSLEDWQGRVAEAIAGAESQVVEFNVPKVLGETLRAWVEGQGARCGLTLGVNGVCFLVINLGMAPPPPAPEQLVEG